MEPIARFVRVARRARPSLMANATLAQLLGKVEQVLSPYWQEWDDNASTYLVPAETAYSNTSGYRSAFNQAASIGMAYVELWEAGGKKKYLDRAVKRARQFEVASVARRVQARPRRRSYPRKHVPADHEGFTTAHG